MLDTVMAAAFQNVQGADDVAFDVGMRVLERVTHAGLRGEVDDLLETFLREQRFHRRAVLEIDAHHRERVVVIEKRSARLLQRDVVVVVEVIEAHDRVAALQELLRGVKADEPGGACDEYLHAGVFPAAQFGVSLPNCRLAVR